MNRNGPPAAPEAAGPIAGLKFRWDWRPYQTRVLDGLARSLSDGRLHVVAAPGSGKTCLGIEVFRRLGRPALVLTPTCTIRDQWIDRLADFLPEGEPAPPTWSGRQLDEPSVFTAATYQSLHARYRRDAPEAEENDAADAGDAPPTKDLDALVPRLRDRGVGTVILDEAHHLRREWWEALRRLVDELHGAVVVALTATPPYDVVGTEWRRYEELCGPVDEQIGVPELVRSGTLCVHQDYVWAVRPPREDGEALHRYDESAERVVTEAAADFAILDAVRAHPWIALREIDVAAALDDPELLTAMLVFLRAKDAPLPGGLLRLLGCAAGDLPAFDRRWCQVLLQHYLFGSTWAPSADLEAHRASLLRSLQKEGFVHASQLCLADSPLLRRDLRMTGAKRFACVGIYRLEREVRGDELRQVVLTDFVREAKSSALGAVPIFGALLHAMPEEERDHLALLTGGLSVLPTAVVPALRSALGVNDAALGEVPWEANARFARLSGAGHEGMVEAVTRLLGEGRIRVLVGTRALLGEGWDAPAVNSLVLASYVGSYVLSNQMRGRALRADPRQPDKAASIWHVVAVEPRTPAGLTDLEELARRFRTFVGLAASRPVIESGLERLSLPSFAGEAAIEEVNRISADRLRRSTNLVARWREAIEGGTMKLVRPTVRAPRPPRMASLVFGATLRNLVVASCGVGAAAGARVLPSLLRTRSPRDLVTGAVVGGVAIMVFALPGLVRAGRLWLRCLPVDGSLRQIGAAVRDALADAGEIGREHLDADLRAGEVAPGVWSLALPAGSFHESSVFADALREVLSPVENPRYLISRRRNVWLWSRRDYHAVPHVLGQDKKRSLAFFLRWKERLGPAELIFTRSEEGRRALLRARARSFADLYEPGAERLDRWE